MLIAMAGLPATGKSAIATRLVQELGGAVLSKDRVRGELFPPPVLDYSRAQDDITMTAVYQAAAYCLRTKSHQAVVIDGRTFLRAYQVEDLLALGRSVNQTPYLLECVCADAVAKERLEADLASGRHPARNRTYALYCSLKAAAEPIRIPHLTLDTGNTPLDECVRQCRAYLSSR